MKRALTLCLCLVAALIAGGCKGDKTAADSAANGWQTIHTNGFDFVCPSAFHRIEAESAGEAIDPESDMLVLSDDLPKTYVGFEVRPVASELAAADEFRSEIGPLLAEEGTTLVSQAFGVRDCQVEMKMNFDSLAAKHVWWAMKAQGSRALWLYYVVDADDEDAYAPFADEIINSIQPQK